jgi:hypothetical protein
VWIEINIIDNWAEKALKYEMGICLCGKDKEFMT